VQPDTIGEEDDGASPRQLPEAPPDLVAVPPDPAVVAANRLVVVVAVVVPEVRLVVTMAVVVMMAVKMAVVMMAVPGAGRGRESCRGESQGCSDGDVLQHGRSPWSRGNGLFESDVQKRSTVFGSMASPPFLICVQYTQFRGDA